MVVAKSEHNGVSVSCLSRCSLDGALNEEIVDLYIDMLVAATKSQFVIILGSRLLQLESSQQEGVFKQERVGLADVDLALLPIHDEAKSHWTLIASAQRPRLLNTTTRTMSRSLRRMRTVHDFMEGASLSSDHSRKMTARAKSPVCTATSPLPISTLFQRSRIMQDLETDTNLR